MNRIAMEMKRFFSYLVFFLFLWSSFSANALAINNMSPSEALDELEMVKKIEKAYHKSLKKALEKKVSKREVSFILNSPKIPFGSTISIPEGKAIVFDIGCWYSNATLDVFHYEFRSLSSEKKKSFIGKTGGNCSFVISSDLFQELGNEIEVVLMGFKLTSDKNNLFEKLVEDYFFVKKGSEGTPPSDSLLYTVDISKKTPRIIFTDKDGNPIKSGGKILQKFPKNIEDWKNIFPFEDMSFTAHATFIPSPPPEFSDVFPLYQPHLNPLLGIWQEKYDPNGQKITFFNDYEMCLDRSVNNEIQPCTIKNLYVEYDDQVLDLEVDTGFSGPIIRRIRFEIHENAGDEILTLIHESTSYLEYLKNPKTSNWQASLAYDFKKIKDIAPESWNLVKPTPFNFEGFYTTVQKYWILEKETETQKSSRPTRQKTIDILIPNLHFGDTVFMPENKALHVQAACPPIVRHLEIEIASLENDQKKIFKRTSMLFDEANCSFLINPDMIKDLGSKMRISLKGFAVNGFDDEGKKLLMSEDYFDLEIGKSKKRPKTQTFSGTIDVSKKYPEINGYSLKNSGGWQKAFHYPASLQLEIQGTPLLDQSSLTFQDASVISNSLPNDLLGRWEIIAKSDYNYELKGFPPVKKPEKEEFIDIGEGRSCFGEKINDEYVCKTPLLHTAEGNKIFSSSGHFYQEQQTTWERNGENLELIEQANSHPDDPDQYHYLRSKALLKKSKNQENLFYPFN